MDLVIDIGNSDVVFALGSQYDFKYIWRIETNTDKIASEYEIRLRQFALENDVDLNLIQSISISSVVPAMNEKILQVCSGLGIEEPFLIDGVIINKLDLEIDNPYEIGTDLASNAIGAYDICNQACLVIDFGTALTFTSVSSRGKILGVAIAPGVKTAMKALSSNTAKLPEIPLEIPEKLIGRNTIQAMQSGIMQGYVGLVKHMVEKTIKDIGEDTKVFATGGLSFIFKPLMEGIFDDIRPHLTLDGILSIRNRVV